MKINKHKYTLEKYIEISKTDIIVYLSVFIITLIITLYFSYKRDTLFYLFLTIIPLILLIGRIQSSNNLKKIKKYIDTNKLKYNELIYWNEKNYILTDTFMLLIYNGKISSFTYEEIKSIYKEKRIKLKATVKESMEYEEYLHIILKNEREYKILISDLLSIRTEELTDISDFLLEKNKNIKIEKNCNQIKL